METRANYIIVGIFTLLVLAASFWFIYWVANVDQRANLVPVNVRIEGAVTGLSAGSPVHFNGIRVGKVVRVVFDADDPRVVFALTHINADTPIRLDTDATIAAQGLTGEAYIALKGGSPESPFLLTEEETDIIPRINASPSAVADILETVREVAAKADTALTSLEGLISENREPLTNTFKNVETFSNSLARNADGVDKFLASTADLGETLSNLSNKLDGTIKGVENIVQAVDADKVRTTISNVESFSKNLKNSGDQVEVMIASVQKISVELQSFSTNLNTSLAKFDGLISAVESDKVKSTINDISDAASGAKQLVADAKSVTATFAERRGDIDQIISDARDMAARLKTSSGRVDSVLIKLEGFLGTGDASGVMADARATLTEFRKVATNLNTRIDQISGGINQFANGGLQDVQALVNDSRRSISRIERVITNIERDPGGFVFGNSGVKTYNGRPRR